MRSPRRHSLSPAHARHVEVHLRERGPPLGQASGGMMAPRKKKPDDAELKAAIVDAALPHVPFDGFTDKVLRQAGEEAGAGKDAVAQLFPEGALSLVEACSAFADQELEKRLAARDLKAMKVRE